MSASTPSRVTSRTALGVAALRAVHQLFDGEPKILSDPIAQLLLGEDARQMLAQRVLQADSPDATGLRAHVVLRSRFAEDRLAEAVVRGVRQLVVLGAGFDTFAYRQPQWASALRIFEVDQPATQVDKQERLQRAGIAQPANLQFVAIDFETTSLRQGLVANGLDFSQPTFFSCLGVLMYLNDAAVQAIFRLVAEFPSPSEIVFTFSTAEARESELAQRAGALGEPWQSHLDPRTLPQQLQGLGFPAVDVLGLAEAQRYFSGRSDGLQPPRRVSIATARVGA